MPGLGFTSAFQHYNARLNNPQWSVSAWTDDGQYLVVSLWEHHGRLGTVPGAFEFIDNAHRWAGPGNAEFRRNLQEALSARKPVRIVLTRAQNAGQLESGKSANKVKKSFHVRDDLVGEVVQFDPETGDYLIRFTNADVAPVLNA